MSPCFSNHSSLKEQAKTNPQLAALLHRMRTPEKLAEAGVRITEWRGHMHQGSNSRCKSGCSTHDTVKVRPGVYRFRWFPDVNNGWSAPLYAEITWIREPDPVVEPPLPAKKKEEE